MRFNRAGFTLLEAILSLVAGAVILFTLTLLLNLSVSGSLESEHTVGGIVYRRAPNARTLADAYNVNLRIEEWANSAAYTIIFGGDWQPSLSASPPSGILVTSVLDPASFPVTATAISLVASGTPQPRRAACPADFVAFNSAVFSSLRTRPNTGTFSIVFARADGAILGTAHVEVGSASFAGRGEGRTSESMTLFSVYAFAPNEPVSSYHFYRPTASLAQGEMPFARHHFLRIDNAWQRLDHAPALVSLPDPAPALTQGAALQSRFTYLLDPFSL